MPNSHRSRSQRSSAEVDPRSLDVVIVTFESEASIAHCLEAASVIPGIGNIIVVDHGNDQSAEIATAFGATVVRDPKNPGFGAGQNHGRSFSSSEFILMLNPDAVPDPEAIAEGLEIISLDASLAAVQGVITDADSGEPERSAGRDLSAWHLWGRALGLRRVRHLSLARSVGRRIPPLVDHVDRVPSLESDVRSLGATALLARRRALEDVGGFDERFFMYGEDADLCMRLREVGWHLHALPIDWATHRAGSSSSNSLNHEVLWWQGAMTFAARWYKPASWVMALAACTVRAGSLCFLHPRQAGPVFRSLVVDPVSARRKAGRERL
jgi:GT2 family glycosyltransferase